MPRILSLALAFSCFASGLAACSTESPAPVVASHASANGKYLGYIRFTPTQPVPGKVTAVQFELKSGAGVPLPGAAIVVQAARDADKVAPITLTDSGGGLYAGKLTFASEGKWQVTVGVAYPDGTDTFLSQVQVTCSGGGKAGSACCDDQGCGAPLTCVHGTCAAVLSPVAGGCYTHDDCTSGWCGADVCEPKPSCTDGKANGVETGVDCGGAACGKCADGVACAVGADCANASCVGAVCKRPGALLGSGGAKGAVDWFTVADQKLSNPAALAFNPGNTDELWIASQKTDALTVVIGVDSDKPVVKYYPDLSAHFLEEVVSISFSDEPIFGTCGESKNSYNGTQPENTFMGPVMWPSAIDDFEAFGTSKEGGGAAGAHFDMLHNTPLCMGIVSAGGRSFFTFNGMIGTVDWYDFKEPHEHGGEDHKDGTKRRFQGIDLKRKPGVPSHMAFDAATGSLYIADSGNGRVVEVDTLGGTPGKSFGTYPNEKNMEYVNGAPVLDLVPKGTDGLTTPSGLVLHGGFLYVSDNATGALHAFALDGTPVNKLATGLAAGALAGLAVGPDARLYLVDRKGNRVLRVEPK